MDGHKKMLRGILTASPTAMTIQQLAKEYRNTIGEPIPYFKFGFNSLEHFLWSIPDTVRLQGSGPFAILHPVASEKSSHVMELVSKQKIERKKYQRMPLMKRHIVGSPQPLFNKTFNQPVSRAPSQKIFYPDPKPSSSSTSEILVNSPSTSTPIDSKAAIEKLPVVFNSNNKKLDLENTSKKLELMNISTSKVFDAQNLRRSHSSSSNSSLLVVPEERHTNTTAKMNINFTNASNGYNSSCNNTNMCMDEAEARVPMKIRSNLKILIEKHPDGIWCADIPGVYRKMFKRELKYQDLGFRTLIDLCMCLKTVFHYVRPSTEDYKLYDRHRPLPDEAKKFFTASSFGTKSSTTDCNSALPTLDWCNVGIFLPPNVFKPGNEIPRTFVPEHTKENDTIDILMGEVFDLSKFWVYIDDGKLDTLMDDMQTFYREQGNEYKLPQNLIKEGIYCVTIIIGEYHRALIVDTMSQDDDFIRVFFIDYGTMAKVKSDLYFLHEQFATLPAQTIRCRLANICPPTKGAPWSHESTVEFRKMVKNKDLTAKISRVDWKEQYLEIFLADVTDGQNVFYINNVLVEKGYAVFAGQEQKISLIDSLSTPIVNLIHLFPTFKELEYGLAPSTSEMEIYNKCNIPINFCYPQYFNVDYCEEEAIIKQQEEFYENNILKAYRKSLHQHHNIDSLKFEDKPLDFSIFGELEGDIREFLKNDPEYEETFTVNEEEENELPQIEKWNYHNESELKKDCLLSEDIMKDILDICQLTKQVSEEDNSVRLFDADIDEDASNSFQNHPLLDLSFSRSNSSGSFADGESEKDDNISDVNKDEFDSDSLEINEEFSEQIIVNTNNPFLNGLNLDDIDSNVEIVNNNGRLLPTNPFLSYIPAAKDDLGENSDSTTSTDYGTCIEEVKIEQTWSTVDHVTSDMSLSQSVDSEQNSINVPDQFTETSHSTSTSFEVATRTNPAQSIPAEIRPGFNVTVPEFYPQNYFYHPPHTYYSGYPPAYPQQFPVHPFLNNPYYNMPQQQFNRQLFMRSTYNRYNVTQKAEVPSTSGAQKPVCPPPGFEANSNVFTPQTNNPQTKDFYESYNEMLKQLHY